MEIGQRKGNGKRELEKKEEEPGNGRLKEGESCLRCCCECERSFVFHRKFVCIACCGCFVLWLVFLELLSACLVSFHLHVSFVFFVTVICNPFRVSASLEKKKWTLFFVLFFVFRLYLFLCFIQRVTAELAVEKGRLGEMQQMEAISKAIAYGNSRRKQAEVRYLVVVVPSLPRLALHTVTPAGFVSRFISRTTQPPLVRFMP